MRMEFSAMLKPFVGNMCSVLLVLASVTLVSSANANLLTQDQQNYLDARTALSEHQMKKYDHLRTQLAHYPLNVYLDFHANTNTILNLKGKAADKALEPFKETPLFNTIRYRYLLRTGNQKRWNDFLTISPALPNNVTLQCYYYRAKLFKGDTKLAYKGRHHFGCMADHDQKPAILYSILGKIRWDNTTLALVSYAIKF